MDVPIARQSRALLLRYEHDRSIIESAARDAIKQSGAEGDRYVVDMQLHPHDPEHVVRKLPPTQWEGSFGDNERFAAALTAREGVLGMDQHLPVHLFPCAPLALVFHLASCLHRRPLAVYQQAPGGSWSLGYSRATAAASEDFFHVEGLPEARQGGRGHVVLVVQVTRSIRDTAVEQFQAEHRGELLATVVLTPVGGPSPSALKDPTQATRAAEQFRKVLDDLHQRLAGAVSVLLVMDCPVSFAAALGTAVNAETQLPLRLHHFENAGQKYEPVHLIHPRRVGERGPVVLTAERKVEALQELAKVRKVHEELVAWLNKAEQQRLVALLDGDALLRSHVVDEVSEQEAPLFGHVEGTWTFQAELLLGLKKLRERLNSESDWKECVRLLFVHEVFHVHQGGLTSYNYRGSGRTGFVLEAADFDADWAAVEVALEWRKAKQGGTVADAGDAKTLEDIVWNTLESFRVFEPTQPVKELSERRLRRYLIWIFHACRLNALSVRREARPRIDRVTIEIAGLPTFQDPYELYPQQRIRLEGTEKAEQLALAVYFQRKLVREQDGIRSWVERLFKLFQTWGEQPRDQVHASMRRLFAELFSKHPELLTSAP